MTKNENIVIDYTIKQNGTKLLKGKESSINDAMKRIESLMTKKMGIAYNKNAFCMAPIFFYGSGTLYLLELKSYLGL